MYLPFHNPLHMFDIVSRGRIKDFEMGAIKYLSSFNHCLGESEPDFNSHAFIKRSFRFPYQLSYPVA